MSQINWPSNPIIGQVYTSPNGTSWEWNGYAWDVVINLPQGPTGDTGPQGVQGVQGTQGLEGSTGVQGTQGTQGVQGPQGIEGSTGVQGPQGFQGVQGTQGFQGVQGTQGIEGSTGVQGPQGIEGSTGVQGPQGPQGFQGSQGVQGPQGFQGTQGVQGPQGVQGVQGPQGVQGFQGRQGVQGFTGIDGMDGSNSGRWALRSTTISTPGATEFYTNSATPTSITSISVNAASLNGSYGTWLEALEDFLNSGNLPILQIYRVGFSTVFGIYEVASMTITLDRGGSPAYADLTLTPIVGGGSLTILREYAISWIVNGTKGVTGSTGPTGATGTTGLTGATGPTGPSVSIVQVTGITVSTGGWGATGSIYEYDISDANIGASSIVDVIPANADYSTVVAAELLPENVSSSGQVTIFANNIPTANFSVTINIFN
jgi:hypothetical protein